MEFINNEREIIGSNTIALITCYVAESYLDIVKNNENILLNSKQYECIKEFINFAINKNIYALEISQREIENNLKELDNSFYFTPINKNAINFPYFKSEGDFSELNFG